MRRQQDPWQAAITQKLSGSIQNKPNGPSVPMTRMAMNALASNIASMGNDSASNAGRRGESETGLEGIGGRGEKKAGRKLPAPCCIN
ncbi:hypothetical protein [Janthinobacterium sp. SUN033]|uniref:hypothetical protein n=1 Tax=Janthinobacterium sp. SUN033 TaxID=3002439 RepID=UPI0025B0A209|nr:hypothetical protein [Janthinobacterium sp. SUN033]MDN2677132.1 hypothetical protein [Janthinobacterium sp. SUN033]